MGFRVVRVAVIGQGQLNKTAAAAAKLGAWLARLAGLGRRRPRPGEGRWLIGAVEFGLVLLIAFLAARLFWTIFEPMPAIEAPPPSAVARPAPIAVGNPFRTAGAPAAVDSPGVAALGGTNLSLVLRGTWLDPERASAVIATPDGKQKTYFVGDAICCGATLAEVFRDKVIISRDGMREALHLPTKQDKPYTPPSLPSASAPPPVKSFSDLVRIEPKLNASGISEVRLHPGADPARFASLGFSDGDELIAINGQPLPKTPVELDQAIQDMRGARQISVTVERNGVRLPITVPLAGGQ